MFLGITWRVWVAMGFLLWDFVAICRRKSAATPTGLKVDPRCDPKRLEAFFRDFDDQAPLGAAGLEELMKRHGFAMDVQGVIRPIEGYLASGGAGGPGRGD